MIRSFRCRHTERVFRRERPRRSPASIHQRAYRRLGMLHAARALDDLRLPPANLPEALSGDRAGQHSVRINQQWRICFVGRDGGADDVEIVDYD